MRYEFVPDKSALHVRMHAFLHKAGAEASDVRGWFETGDDLFDDVQGEASIAIDGFVFGNPLLARTAKAWIKAQKRSELVFRITGATGSGRAGSVTGELTIGAETQPITADVEVADKDGTITISGMWQLSQKAFSLSAPPGVKDRVDIEFELVAAPA